MKKTILITGSTDGIGLEAARELVAQGHEVLVHGRNPAKLARVQSELSGGRAVRGFVADLSTAAQVEAFAAEVARELQHLDVLINNAGVFKVRSTRTSDGLDVRFAVNTLAPYLLTKRLLPLMDPAGRVVNISSAAQAPVNEAALVGQLPLSDNAAYAQSKLALTMWSFDLARSLGSEGPAIIAVNPGSMLATKMVKDAFGVSGADVGIGRRALVQAALSSDFEGASGRYFDTDIGRFAPAHPHSRDSVRAARITAILEALISA